MTIASGQTWTHTGAVCADCGEQVRFFRSIRHGGQGVIRTFDATCPIDPNHALGDEAARMLARVRGNHR